MAIHSRGYAPNEIETAQDKALFLENLQLILEHEQEILDRAEYFFCSPSFAWCSWPYVSGDGPLPLGYLLLGWRDGLLIEPCPSCAGKVLVTTFGGSPLSGSCSWSGFCQKCHTIQRGTESVHKPFHSKIQFVSTLRKEFPYSISHSEEYDGNIFSWGGNGLQPARKTRTVHATIAKGVSLDALIKALTENGT